MPDPLVFFIGCVFLSAGFVKGVIGLGLPTISMGLLALVMTPPSAAALLIVPSLVTNAWQAFAGGRLGRIVGRLWPMQAGVCLGTWAGAGLMTGGSNTLGTALLGICLMAYAGLSLANTRLSVPARSEIWLGPLAGAITGLITAATGVFVIPAVPYLQAIGLEKDDLVQALGLSFTVSTLALAANLVRAGLLDAMLSPASIATLAMAGIGMWSGQLVRAHMDAQTFRRWFFLGLLALGVYIAARSVL
jgi:uncharacterized membrane protein YfcA